MVDGTMILTMTNVVVVNINVVVNAIVSTTTYYPVVEKVNDGKLCVVVNNINDGAFNDHGRPHFCGR